MVILHVQNPVYCYYDAFSIVFVISFDAFQLSPLMSSLKQPCADEKTTLNPQETPIRFVNGLKCCCTSNKVMDEEIRVLWEKWANDDVEKAKEQRQEMFAKVKLEAETQGAEDELMFAHVLPCMTDFRFGSLHVYLHCLMTAKAQHTSYQA